tara:strand:- start:74 stop:427 length:354 start_codon:yes stop_codon:yes gene_type:complete
MNWLNILKGRKEHPKTSYGDRKKTKKPSGSLRTGSSKLDKPVPSKLKDAKEFMDINKPTQDEMDDWSQYEYDQFEEWFKTQKVRCPSCEGEGKITGEKYADITGSYPKSLDSSDNWV